MKKLSIVLFAALGLSLGVATPGHAKAMACEDDSGVCVDSGDATFTADKTATKKQRKRRSSGKGGKISMTVDGGRGSLFINGRYAGTAPLEDVKIPAGVNDIQIRDGAKVLAQGTLKVPRSAKVAITVNGT